MNLFVGVLFLLTGTILVLTGVALAVAEIISGRHGAKAPVATTMAGYDWTGLGAIFKGLAAIFKAMQDWPLPGILGGLGLIFDVLGIFVLAAKPI
jgi:hypothetical protein